MSRSDFTNQLDWMQRHFDVVSLEEIQTRLRQGTNKPAVAITFDDGYAENADFAIPELARRRLPATYFVSTDFVDSELSFPHDLAAGVSLPANTSQQLRDFQAAGIEIGAHTRSHRDMGTVEDKALAEFEIRGSIEQLEQWLGVPVRYFAFPFGLPGNMSQLAVDVLAECGIQGFCSAYGAWNWPAETEPFHLRRIHADPGMERLKNWLTLDPRKLAEDVELPFRLPVGGNSKQPPVLGAKPDVYHDSQQPLSS